MNLDGCCFIKEVIFQCITFKTSYVTECYILHLHNIMSICKAKYKLFIVCPYLNPFYLFYFYVLSCFTFTKSKVLV